MTVGVIRDAILRSQENYDVRKLAEDITPELRAKDYLSECLAYFHWVKANTRYMRDPRTVELVKAPWIVLKELAEGRKPQLDCDDLAALIGSLCLITGAETRIVTVAFDHAFYNEERQYSHVFAQANVRGSWLTLDTVPARTYDMLNRVVAAKVWLIA